MVLLYHLVEKIQVYRGILERCGGQFDKRNDQAIKKSQSNQYRDYVKKTRNLRVEDKDL